ncbi:hypothetical protein FS749_013632 [Ceratobasidium sp. UAMH 11750]|nr:hypothetical protein FS749_013632 [Ceratobasidium sp. UAMH 11750]
MSRLMFVLFYLAMRDGDEISEISVPRGTKSSVGGKHQLKRAKLLRKLRTKYFESIGSPHLAPDLANCFPSRNLLRHYRQILRFCVAVYILDSRQISPTMANFAQDILESLCVEYTHMNVPLSPTFHYMQHLEDTILQTGSLNNTHVWPMERANGIISNIRHNGRGKGVLEGTLMRGWWEHASLWNLIRRFQAIPNRLPADEAIINDLLMAMRGGPEHAQQRGTLMAFIAQSRTAYAQPVRLSNQSKSLKMDIPLWRLVVAFCNQVWPNTGIFGPDAIRDKFLPREGAVRNFSYVEYEALRYGSYWHTSGRRACYGYIDRRHAVRIERVLSIEIPDRPDMRTICVIVRRFEAPVIEPVFPWDAWRGHLGVNHWEYNQLSDPIAIPVDRLSGLFALMRVPMSYGQYWVTIALNNLEPEEDQEDEAGGEWE